MHLRGSEDSLLRETFVTPGSLPGAWDWFWEATFGALLRVGLWELLLARGRSHIFSFFKRAAGASLFRAAVLARASSCCVDSVPVILSCSSTIPSQRLSGCWAPTSVILVFLSLGGVVFQRLSRDVYVFFFCFGDLFQVLFSFRPSTSSFWAFTGRWSLSSFSWQPRWL